MHLEEAATASSHDLVAPSEPAAIPQLQVWQRPIQAVIVALAVAAIAGLAVWALTRPTPAPAATVTRFAFIPPDGRTINIAGGIALSPDGRTLAYAGRRDGRAPVVRSHP